MSLKKKIVNFSRHYCRFVEISLCAWWSTVADSAPRRLVPFEDCFTKETRPRVIRMQSERESRDDTVSYSSLYRMKIFLTTEQIKRHVSHSPLKLGGILRSTKTEAAKAAKCEMVAFFV